MVSMRRCKVGLMLLFWFLVLRVESRVVEVKIVKVKKQSGGNRPCKTPVLLRPFGQPPTPPRVAPIKRLNAEGCGEREISAFLLINSVRDGRDQ